MVAKIFLFAASLYTTALTVVSLIHLGKISIGSFEPTDKMMHATAYLLLVIVWKIYFVLKSSDFLNYTSNLLKIAGASLLFGMLIEVLQGTLTSYRTPDWFDILANSTGIVLAVLLLLALKKPIWSLKSKINLIL
ncbi:MAG: VanZ family protein [Salegentibacter sp.]